MTGVNDPPVAAFSASSTSGIGPLSVTFTDSSTDIDNNIVTWNWDFGDGTAPSPLQNPSHVFNQAGVFTVTLTVTDESGATASTTVDITVMAAVTINDVSGAETRPQSTADFTVSLSVPSAVAITVEYVTVNGTATAGQDYTSAGGILTFAPWVTTQPIAVTILNDALIDPGETFSVNLFNSAPASITTIPDPVGECTITDNDRTLTIVKTGSGIGSVVAGPGAPSTLPGGTINNADFPQTFIYEQNDAVTLTATPDALPDPGSIFKDWDGDTSNPTTVTVDNNKVVAAFFAQQYRLTPTLPGPGGTITPAAPVIVEHGTELYIHDRLAAARLHRR